MGEISLEARDVEIAKIISPELWGTAFAYPDHIDSDDDLEAARNAALHKARAITRALSEREAVVEECAKVADEQFAESGWGGHYQNAGIMIATAIRALATPAEPGKHRLSDGEARVVAWLREHCGDPDSPVYFEDSDLIADAIEAGEHVGRDRG